MKFFKIVFAGLSILFLFIFFSSSITGCAKQTTTVHDTTTIVIRDTTVIKDTVVINDTLGNLSDGLVAYYNFNGGNLNDSSGNNNNIVFNNAVPAVDRFGVANNAYLFNGDSSYMQVRNSTSINPSNITLFAIVKVNGFNEEECHGNQILSKGYPYNTNGFYQLNFFALNNGANGVCYGTVDTTQELFTGSYGDNIPQGVNAGAAGLSVTDSVLVQRNQWYTLVYTYDGTTAKFYVNGALATSAPNASAISFTPNSNDLFIGKHENPAFPYFFKGVIDEIRIYNKAITNQQVGYLSIMKTKYLKMANKLIY